MNQRDDHVHESIGATPEPPPRGGDEGVRGPDSEPPGRDQADELILGSSPAADAETTVAGSSSEAKPDPPRPRRTRLPLILFLITCLSTFWVGANHYLPVPVGAGLRQTLIAHWHEGLTYMACVLAILLTHEM